MEEARCRLPAPAPTHLGSLRHSPVMLPPDSTCHSPSGPTAVARQWTAFPLCLSRQGTKTETLSSLSKCSPGPRARGPGPGSSGPGPGSSSPVPRPRKNALESLQKGRSLSLSLSLKNGSKETTGKRAGRTAILTRRSSASHGNRVLLRQKTKSRGHSGLPGHSNTDWAGSQDIPGPGQRSIQHNPVPSPPSAERQTPAPPPPAEEIVSATPVRGLVTAARNQAQEREIRIGEAGGGAHTFHWEQWQGHSAHGH